MRQRQIPGFQRSVEAPVCGTRANYGGRGAAKMAAQRPQGRRQPLLAAELSSPQAGAPHRQISLSQKDGSTFYSAVCAEPWRGRPVENCAFPGWICHSCTGLRKATPPTPPPSLEQEIQGACPRQQLKKLGPRRVEKLRSRRFWHTLRGIEEHKEAPSE